MLAKIGFRIFSKILEPYLNRFEPLREALLKAEIKVSIDEYLSNALFLCTVSFVVLMPLLSLVFAVMLLSAPLAFTGAAVASFLASAGIFAFYVSYPVTKASTRKRKIENVLPFATTYMATIMSSGVTPSVMFKILSGFEEYGELSKEIGKIYMNMEMFGMDIRSAIQNVAAKTPSDDLKELLWGMASIITTGGSLSEFLRQKGKEYMNSYRRKLDSYSQQMSLFTEIYITLIIVGSVFFLILTAIMSAIATGGDIVPLQFFIIFFFLPMVSVGFIVMIKGISPIGE